MSVVAEPGARKTFTPRELTDAYKDFIERAWKVNSQKFALLDSKTGVKSEAL